MSWPHLGRPACNRRSGGSGELNAAEAKALKATWQCCRVRFMRNALAHANKTQRRMVSAAIATAFAQVTSKAAHAQWRGSA